VLVSGALLVGCSRNHDPVLSPNAVLASQDGRVLDALDLVRDAALLFTNDANTGQLPLGIARQLVQVHSSSLKLLEVRSAGYAAIIQTTLAEVVKQLPPNVNRVVAPYAALASTLLNVLTNRAIDEALSAETIAAYHRALAASLAQDATWLISH
jgi:hypothetical protein